MKINEYLFCHVAFISPQIQNECMNNLHVDQPSMTDDRRRIPTEHSNCTIRIKDIMNIIIIK